MRYRQLLGTAAHLGKRLVMASMLPMIFAQNIQAGAHAVAHGCQWV
jgi:preprotein translocase subunit SecY